MWYAKRTMNRPHIAVFFGGASASHDLSRETGRWVCQYIPRSQYQVTPVKVTTQGLWQVPLGNLPESGNIDLALDRLFAAIPALHPTKALERLVSRPLGALMTVLRGAGGDDGVLHSFGQALNIPVVGSPLSTCQQTSHKYLTAQAIEDVATAPHARLFRATVPLADIAADVEAEFIPPLFIKPVTQEGSLGIEEVQDVADLESAIVRALQYGDIIVQEKAEGTELSLTFMQDEQEHIHALPPTVVIPHKASYYDHLAKRVPGRVTLHHPTENDNPVIMEAQTIARDVFEHLGCRGVVSIDMISTDNIIDILDVNTIPVLSSATPLLHQLRQANIHPTSMLEAIIGHTLLQG